jgi:outer membrane immunogenic protein
MNKLVASLSSIFAAAVVAAGPAQAADMPVKAPPVAVFNWTGCYVGGNGGWKWGRFKDQVQVGQFTGVDGTAFPGDLTDLGTLDKTSGAAGGQAGCRWETPAHWVLGVEGDYDWTDLSGTLTNRQGVVFPGTRGVFVPGDFFADRARSESSARFSVGRAFDRTLIYLTVGVGFTQLSMDGTFIPATVGGVAFPGLFGSGSKTVVGGTAGAGVAYAVGDFWDVGAEYRYTQYAISDFTFGNLAAACAPGGACVTTPATGHKELQTQEVLLKLNFRFGGGWVSARY